MGRKTSRETESCWMCLTLSIPSPCRCYSFGIGPSACRRLVQGLATVSRGSAEFLAEGERLQPKVRPPAVLRGDGEPRATGVSPRATGVSPRATASLSDTAVCAARGRQRLSRRPRSLSRCCLRASHSAAGGRAGGDGGAASSPAVGGSGSVFTPRGEGERREPPSASSGFKGSCCRRRRQGQESRHQSSQLVLKSGSALAPLRQEVPGVGGKGTGGDGFAY